MEPEKQQDRNIEGQILGSQIPANYQQQDETAFSRFLLGGEDVLTNLKHELRGEIYDYDSDKWVKQKDFEQVINNLGIARILSFVGILLQRIIMTSNYDEKRINDNLYYFEYDLMAMIVKAYMDGNKFELGSDYWDMVIDTIASAVEGGFMKAFEDGERKFWRQNYKTVEMRRPEDRKRSMIPGL